MSDAALIVTNALLGGIAALLWEIRSLLRRWEKERQRIRP